MRIFCETENLQIQHQRYFDYADRVYDFWQQERDLNVLVWLELLSLQSHFDWHRATNASIPLESHCLPSDIPVFVRLFPVWIGSMWLSWIGFCSFVFLHTGDMRGCLVRHGCVCSFFVLSCLWFFALRKLFAGASLRFTCRCDSAEKFDIFLLSLLYLCTLWVSWLESKLQNVTFLKMDWGAIEQLLRADVSFPLLLEERPPIRCLRVHPAIAFPSACCKDLDLLWLAHKWPNIVKVHLDWVFHAVRKAFCADELKWWRYFLLWNLECEWELILSSRDDLASELEQPLVQFKNQITA